jgi:hypothetical protein
VNRTHDYVALRDQFVRGDMGIRELCRINGIANHSPVATKARDDHWAEARAAFRKLTLEKTDDKAADKQAQRRVRAMEVIDHAFDAVDAVLTKLVEDMHATHVVRQIDDDGKEIRVRVPVMRVTPQAAAAIIDRLNVLVGQPSTITEERHSGSVTLDGLPSDVLRAIADAARGATGPKRVGGSPIPRIEAPRPTN